MSQYQYYEFLAVDRPLTGAETAELRKLSTRAEISSTSMVNTYHWGSFRGDPETLVEQYFDAFLYLANWGTRRLMLRLPTRLLDPGTARAYSGDEGAVSWVSGDHVVLSYSSELPEGSWDEDWEGGEKWLPSIVPARAGVAAGDLRLLYLGWLLAAQAGGLDDDELEPPVPRGLSRLNAPLRRFAQFLRVDRDLVEVASQASGVRARATASDRELAAWLAGLPAREKDGLLVDVMRDRPHVGVELMRRFETESRERRGASSGPGGAGSGAGSGAGDGDGRRTVAELLYAADTLRLERERSGDG